MKKLLVICLTAALLTTLFGCVPSRLAKETPSSSATEKSPIVTPESITPPEITTPSPVKVSDNGKTPSPVSPALTYENTDYGFIFTLPASWKGYSIISDTWKGSAYDKNGKEVNLQTGPQISIRNPKWTKAKPYQDIPIMVFTTSQWNALQNDEFHIGAAPIGPTELGRNSLYVFALPARYNFAFLPGYEEVETILNGNPLKTNNNFKKK